MSDRNDKDKDLRIYEIEMQEAKGAIPGPPIRRMVVNQGNLNLQSLSDEFQNILSAINNLADDAENSEDLTRDTSVTFSLALNTDGKLGFLGMSSGVSANASISVTITLSPKNKTKNNE